ncbi:MAG TPA: Fe-S cluster assembly protein IscX [Ignavibacteriaceae bacterium]|jgi:Fe-S-cluster formation regulator IscX/YfhJ|nr:Fe-S cluster assembly protein IscX [Ignavibacteriaceae bacterium]HOJ18042.1 Fe-S cluster assembly protein IscX [Ignavibacteriaceae bacterium]HPO56238.1 Fe-S cluster assembly protein IscX [Ignavibacteriaceae bacterium]
MSNLISDEFLDYIISQKSDILPDGSPGVNLAFDEIYDFLCGFYNTFPAKSERLLLSAYIGVCKKLPLSWNNYEALAFCLNSLYPNTDLLEISDEEVIQKVIALPNFTEANVPPPDDIATAIITIWVDIYYNWEL